MNGTSWTTGSGGGYSNVSDSSFSRSLLSSQSPRERSFISFSDWLDQFPNASEIRRRMSTDPIVRSNMMNAYIQNNPRSARVTASAADKARRSEESPYERTMRLARDYESYKSKASLIPNNPFIMSPEEFAREDARRVADRIQRARQVTRGEYVQDKPEFKGAKAGQEKVKVPVGPGGKLQLDKVGQPATKFRMLPQSEVDRLKMEQGARGLAEERLREDIAMQGDQPRLARQEEELAGIQDTAQVRSELEKFQELVSMDEKIAQDPEYASFMNQGFSAVRGGMSAENALKYVKGLGGVGAVKEQRQRERERLREAARSDLARTERDFKIDYYQWKAGQDQAIRDAQSSGDRQGVAMRAQAAYDDLRAHTGALQRGIDALRVKISRAKDENEKLDIESQVSTLQSELDDARQSMSYYMSIRNAEPPSPTQVTPFPRPYEGQPEGYQGERPRPGFVIVKTQYGKREVSQTQIADIERALKAAGQQYEVIR